MSPTELRYWQNAHAKVATMQPAVAAAVLRAFAIIRDSLSATDLAQFIESRRFDAVVMLVLSDAVLDRAFMPLRQRLREAVQSSVRYAVRSLPNSGKVDGVLAVQFDVLSPSVVNALRTLETAAVTGLKQDVRDVALAFLENGIRDGVGPRALAAEIRSIVGLSPNMLSEIANYRAKLVAGESVTGYSLRDRRRSTTTPEQIDRAVEAYTKRRIAQHAETVSRTATLDAFKAGQQLAWQEAIDRGVVPPGRQLTKTWRGVMDARERDAHIAMEGETVPFDGTYSNGQGYPGQGEYNCRCLSVFRVA